MPPIRRMAVAPRGGGTEARTLPVSLPQAVAEKLALARVSAPGLAQARALSARALSARAERWAEARHRPVRVASRELSAWPAVLAGPEACPQRRARSPSTLASGSRQTPSLPW